MPIFFRAAAENLQPYNAAIKSSDQSSTDEALLSGMRPPKVECYLQDLAQLLNPGSLVVESRRSVLNQLEGAANRTLSWFESNQAERARQVHDAWQAIANACYEFMAQRDDHDSKVNLRLQTSPAIVHRCRTRS